ncbi:MAG: hypothetical protein FJ290_15760 [Planctomycetes bacterium]|nr:hypothetical protein [Planctomycetota bacterium]
MCPRVWAVALLLIGCAVLAGEGEPPRPPLRELTGPELRDAQQMRDRADLLRAAYERPRQGPKGAEKDEGEFAKVVVAYADAIEKYSGSDIAAYCQVRLAGFYQFGREYDKATKVLSDLAQRYAGTEHEAQAYFTLGLMHLQARHDPASALPWFQKVPAPPTAGDDGAVPDRSYGQPDKLYLSSQQSAARCEIRLGKPADAARRIEALGKRYPQYKKSIDGSLRWEVRSALSDHTLKAIKPTEETRKRCWRSFSCDFARARAGRHPSRGARPHSRGPNLH